MSQHFSAQRDKIKLLLVSVAKLIILHRTADRLATTRNACPMRRSKTNDNVNSHHEHAYYTMRSGWISTETIKPPLSGYFTPRQCHWLGLKCPPNSGLVWADVALNARLIRINSLHTTPFRLILIRCSFTTGEWEGNGFNVDIQ